MNTDFVNPTKVSNFCRDILKEYTDNNINVSYDEGDPYSYYLQGAGLTRMIGTHKHLTPAIPLKNRQEYTVHFGIIFIPHDSRKISCSIKGVSLQIFKNDSLLFRAEWDNKDEIETEHPQPHWHIEPVTMFNGMEVRNEVKEVFEEFLQEGQAEREDDFMSILSGRSTSGIPNFRYHDFHFAMSSEWHKKDGKCNIQLTETNLRNWLKQCLKSIDIQLTHIND